MPTAVNRQHKRERGWEIAAKAVSHFNAPVSIEDLKIWLANNAPEYKSGKNLREDLKKITVNGFSRGHHQPKTSPRKSDSGHQHDLLFKNNIGKTVRYELYRPLDHGIWELFFDELATTQCKLRVRSFTEGVLRDYLLAAEQEQNTVTLPEDEVDARVKLAQEIVVRRGQSRFRNLLLDAYDGCCAISGSSAQEVLEAAHIRRYKGDHSDKVSNGLLLRTDIHTLFDLGLIWIEHGLVVVASHLGKSEYAQFADKPLCLPKDIDKHPNPDFLNEHGAKARQCANGVFKPTC